MLLGVVYVCVSKRWWCLNPPPITTNTPQVVLLGHRPMYVLSYWDDGPADPMSDSDQTVARLLQVRKGGGSGGKTAIDPYIRVW